MSDMVWGARRDVCTFDVLPSFSVFEMTVAAGGCFVWTLGVFASFGSESLSIPAIFGDSDLGALSHGCLDNVIRAVSEVAAGVPEGVVEGVMVPVLGTVVGVVPPLSTFCGVWSATGVMMHNVTSVLVW